MSTSPHLTRVASALSPRAGRAIAAVPVLERRSAPPGQGASPPDPALVDHLRSLLLAGDTHYPDRPGLPELRGAVARRLAELGCPVEAPSGVLITAGEGESLLTTLLGLEIWEGSSVVAHAGSRHAALFAWVGIVLVAPGSEGAAAAYVESGDAPEPPWELLDSMPRVQAVGTGLFGEPACAPTPGSLVLGDLLPDTSMAPFRLGFVAGEPEVIARITKWKQASSICCAGPSQRALLWSLEAR